MKKTLLFSLAASLVFFMTSCGDGFEETETGILYKLHVHNEDSAKPAEGDIIFLDIKIKTCVVRMFQHQITTNRTTGD
jgi:hypothetical protein